jgi:Subtilase family/Bacterial Ig domain/Fervidolysin N-terminal prodomain
VKESYSITQSNKSKRFGRLITAGLISSFALAASIWFGPGAEAGSRGQKGFEARQGTSEVFGREPDQTEFVPGRVLVGFRKGLSAKRAHSTLMLAGTMVVGTIPGIDVQIVQVPEYADEQAYVRYFRSLPDVDFAELDRILPVEEMVPNDPWYQYEGHLRNIAAPNAWPTTTGSSDVTIAIIDTGVDGTHEDLVSKMVPGWNIYNDNSNTADVYGHGTKVAGTAGASSNNNTGVASVAWGCLLMPVRVSAADGTATTSAIASGLTWAADHGARVANISYMVSDSSTVTSAARYFQNKGGVVTASAGNYGTFDSAADNPYILTISATDGNNVLYSWSNTGNNVDLAAPGTVYSTVSGGGYSSGAGTSFSAPIVAGVAALVFSANPSLTGAEVCDILKQSADDFGTVGWDSSYGWGRVNAARAVGMAGTGGQPVDSTPPDVSLTSPSPGATVSGTTMVEVAASDNVGVASVSFSVDGVLMGGDNTAPYTFSWNTTGVSNGPHTLTASAQDSAGNSGSTSVTVTVGNFADSMPPTISITSPMDGSSISKNITVSVSTYDNVGVVKVELYVDGELKTTSTSAPFSMRWNPRSAKIGPHYLQCKAYDAAENMRASTVVTVYR